MTDGKKNDFIKTTDSENSKFPMCQSEHTTFNCAKYVGKYTKERHFFSEFSFQWSQLSS